MGNIELPTLIDKKDVQIGVNNIKNPINVSNKRPTCCKLFCCSSLVKRSSSIFERKSETLKPLDGIRAVSILWILLFNCAVIINSNFGWCAADNHIWAKPIDNGGLAADAFFVLSGFLVAHNLYK